MPKAPLIKRAKNRKDARSKSAIGCTVLPSKLAPPSRNTQLIARETLMRELDSGLAKRVTFLHASAGFGKTTLAMQWSERNKEIGTRVAWFSLDETDSNVYKFLRYLTAALTGAGLDIEGFDEIEGQAAKIDLDSIFTAIVSGIAFDGSSTIIVLDDYHRVLAPDIDMLVKRLIAVMPENLHLLVTSRQRPDLDFADLSANGNLQELTSPNLRFTVKEMEALLSGVVDTQDIPALFERTEGWGVAAQLAKAYFARTDTKSNEVDTFTGGSREIQQYIEEQILAGLPDRVLEFLIETSILEDFDSDLANYVRDETDSQEILDSLGSLSSFLFPVDQNGLFYRSHRMFSECLKAKLQRTDQDGFRSLHLRASEWYAKKQMLPAAVKHAQSVGEIDLAAKLIEDQGGWELVISNGVSFVSDLLTTFDTNLHQFPRLELCRVMILAQAGNLADAHRLYEQVRKSTEDFQGAFGEPNHMLERDGNWVGLSLDFTSDMLLTEAGARRLKRLKHLHTQNKDDRYVYVLDALVMSSVSRGDFSTAVDFIHECQIEHRAGRNSAESNSAIFSLLYLGFIEMLRGNLDDALTHFNDAMEKTVLFFGAHSDLKAIGKILISELHYQRDDLERARRFLDKSLRYAADHDCWADIFMSGYQTAIALACSERNYDEAFDWIEQGLATARARNLSRLTDFLMAAKYRVNVNAKNLNDASRARERFSTYEAGRWREAPAHWRQNYAWGIANAEHDIALGKPYLALETLKDLEICCRHIGTDLLLVEVLFLKAVSLQVQGKLNIAGEDLVESLHLAARQNIRRVFLNRGDVFMCLVEECLAESKEVFEKFEVLDFVSGLIESHKSTWETDKVFPAIPLTRREKQILIQLDQGYTNKAIARTLGITDNTVKYHLKNIYTKLDVVKRRDAIELARQRALIH